MKKWFENLKISNKLIIGFITVAFLGVIVGTVGIFNMNKMANNQQTTYDQCTMGIKYASEAEINFTSLGKAMTGLTLNYDDADQRAQYVKKSENYISNIETAFDNYSKTISNDQDQKNYDATKSAYESYLEIINNNLTIARSGGSSSQLLAKMASATTLAENTNKAFADLSDYNAARAQEDLATDKVSAEIAMFVMIGVIIVSVVIALLLSFFISSIISKPMQKFAKFADMLAIGDIEIEKVVDKEDRLWALRQDEIGVLANAFERMIESTAEQAQKTASIAEGDLTTVITVRSEFDVLGKALSELVNKFHSLALAIVSSADQIDSGSKMVADSSTELSQGATEQASSVEQLSASMEEITSQTVQNAQNAHKTNELAKGIQKDANNSNNQMTEMLRAMEEINESSDNISKIIKVIEDIAFQTNILALNAAVEAARAGQYGKGFAVVAEEVRSLAGQSSKAAKETTELIENSIRKVGAGTKIANETATALEKINTGVAQAVEFVDAIATASNEQASAMEQINQGIMQISQVVQTNAAAAEQGASASEELSAQADGLKQHVSVFKLNVNMYTMNNDFQIRQPQIALLKDDSKEELVGTRSGSRTASMLSDKNFGKY
ncbi:MAG: HAMP domain-containing methyl-accepting chemotaxis protein [Clostridiaceae bacterium]|nr:HAMP domain-containing methyl-accepting chemotaxis protein [Clostridiaceae bacterium]